jgi:membrane protease YdiL (CAAX protease family)
VAKPTSLTSIALFVAVAYGFMTAMGVVVFMNGGLVNGGFRNFVGFAAALAGMFSPSLGAVLATKLVNHDSLRANGIAKGRVWHYLVALGYPVAFVLLGLLFVSLLGTATVDFNNLGRIFPTPFAQISILAFPFINFIPALGEEYGWRGFLQPALTKRLGVLQGLTLTGIIWGLWHGPLVWQGYNYWQYPGLIGVALFTVIVILLGYFLGWLRIRSNSCFPTALGHGAINAYLAFGTMIAPTQNQLLGLPYGLPAFLALGLLAAVVLYDLRRR